MAFVIKLCRKYHSFHLIWDKQKLKGNVRIEFSVEFEFWGSCNERNFKSRWIAYRLRPFKILNKWPKKSGISKIYCDYASYNSPVRYLFAQTFVWPSRSLSYTISLALHFASLCRLSSIHFVFYSVTFGNKQTEMSMNWTLQPFIWSVST